MTGEKCSERGLSDNKGSPNSGSCCQFSVLLLSVFRVSVLGLGPQGALKKCPVNEYYSNRPLFHPQGGDGRQFRTP